MIKKNNALASRINLSCKKENRTLLENSFADIPYQLMHYGNKNLDKQEHLEMMIMCSSPGVMDNDSLRITIHCKKNAALKLFTQSYNKLHPMKKGARQSTLIKLETDSLLQYIPHPMIPFKDSLFHASTEIRMEETAHLIWGDIISGGRIHSGERFEFKSVHNQTELFVKNELIFCDNQLLEPGKQPIEEMLFFEGYSHQGTLLLVSSEAELFKKELDDILKEQFTDMQYGFTQCHKNAILIRTLGNSGEALHGWMTNVGDMFWSFIQYRQKKKEEEKTINNKTALENNSLKISSVMNA